MNIWIMRHGEAGFNAPSDSERTLTENGREMAFQQGRWLGDVLCERGILLDKILVSPYQRTRQTLECLQDGIQAVSSREFFANSEAGIVEVWEDITPSGSPKTVLDYLAFLKEEGAKNVLIISHLPLVFDLVHALSRQTVHFYPAVIAELNWQNAQATLISHKSP